MPYHWGKKQWLLNFWRTFKPLDEPYSLRQIFYSSLPEIERFVPLKVKDNPKWADYFYTDMCRYLSELVLMGELSYRKLNIFEGGGRNNLIWQNFVFKEARPPTRRAYTEYPLEIWVENNATYNSLERLVKWNIEEQKAPFQINMLSMRGFQSTQLIEDAYLDRQDDIEIVLCFADFDPSGVWMPIDIQNRFKRIGMNVEVQHIGVFPNQIPKEKRTTTLIHYKKKDPRAKAFQEKYGLDQMAYEMQALTPLELRTLLSNKIVETIKVKEWIKKESAENDSVNNI